MFLSKTTLWISIILLVMTYGVFGWLYASWMIAMIQEQNLLAQETNVAIFYGVGAMLVLLIAVIFTAPVSLMNLSLNNWLKSDIRAFLSIFFGALAFAIIVQWLAYFAKFFVLLASAILVKLDLPTVGLNKWLSNLVLAIMSLGSFFGGIIAFNYWG